AFAQITPKPEQPGTAAEWGPVKEITRDEVVQATEPVESTGDAIEAAEAWRTANEEFDGLILSFKPGDERGKDKTAHYYGELAETEDADGMPIDVVLNKDYDAAAPSTPIFIVNQKDWDTGEFRQHKVMAGFDSEEEAQQGFVDMWGDKGFDSIHELNPFGFDEWRAQGDHKAPYTDLAGAEASLRDIEQYMASEEYQTELAEDEGLKDQYDSVLQERRDRVEARQPKPEQPAPEVTPAPEAGEAAPEVAAAPAPSEETEQDRKDRVQIERRERGTQAAKKARAVDTDVDDAVTFIRKLGGLNIESQSDIPAGRLKHLDTKVVGLPGIEQKGDKGLSLEKVTEQLWQEGYIADNDSRLVIDMLFEAEQKPQYTAKGSEAAAQREADAEFERQADAEAQEWADYINESTDIKEVDPETASLMKQAIELDEDATIAIAEKDTDEATFQAQLRELIDERKSQKAEKPSAPAEPAKAVEPDAGQQAPAETEGVIEAAIARWEKTPKGKAAIERQKKESAERDAAYRAQREAEFGPEWAREEHAPFEYQPLDESNPQFQALSESAKDEVRAVKSEMAEVYDNDPADRYLDALQYQLEAIVQRELAPPKEKETGISALDDAAKHHLAKIEKQMEKGRWNATQIPDVRNADGVDSVKSIALYEEALVAAGWKSIMRGKGQFWVNDKGDEIFLSSQGTLAAPIAQYKAWEARGIFDVLNDAMYADPTSVPLNKIKLTYQIGDKKVTHTAEWWVEAFEKRLTRLSELRTCA
ncbi:MAG: hypothetical protein GY815_10995, partial [Gammaproteobacteria bacterium]|nr:hypothetical protein [Gammaproteobacteria bacterium]